jgi:enoyl-CoA hydratase/carnithine racemase
MTADTSSSVQPPVLSRIEARVAVLTLNRPQALNAYTPEMGAQLKQAVLAADADPAVRVIVITGAGRGFCAGADMKVLSRISSDGAEDRGGSSSASGEAEPGDPDAHPGLGPSVREHYSRRFSYLIRARKPVIAAINGAAAGLGLVMALYADIRFASEEARFTTSFSQRGLIAEHGISWLLPRLVGQAHAMELLLSSRKIDAQEAQRIGLVNRLFEAQHFLPEVIAYAQALSDTVSARSMAVIKAQLWKSPFQSFDESLLCADAQMSQSFQAPDFAEGVAHFIEKRPPRFADL